MHTTGSWVARPDKNSSCEWEVVKVDPKTTYGVWYVAGIFDSADDGDAESNARLIAAAPDYAKAAPDAADILDQYADFIRRDVKADDLERHPYLPLIEQTAAVLRAAIARATGASV